MTRTQTFMTLRRRGWVVLLSLVAVGAIAFAVSKALSKDHTANAVLAVPSTSGQTGSSGGSADAASSLANTYTGLIPQDQSVVRSVANAVGTSTTVARRNISVTQRRKTTGLLSLAYTATSRSKAMKGADALVAAVAGSNPGSPRIVPGTVQLLNQPRVTQVAGLSTAKAAAFVPPNPAQEGAGDADAAIKLATTYAGLLPEDSEVIRYVAHRSGLSQADVRSGLTVTNDANSAVIRVRFRSKDAASASEATRAFATAVAGPSPVSDSIAPRSLSVVRLPDKGDAPAAGSTKTVAIGLILGLALGIILLIAWERADPRFDSSRRLSEGLGVPVSEFDRMSAGSVVALIDRWHRVTGHSPSRVAVLAAVPKAEAATGDVIDRLVEAAADDGRAVSDGRGESGFGPVTIDGTLTLVAGGTPGTEAAGERLAAAADMTALVVPKGARGARVSRSLSVLEQFGVKPEWALLVRVMRWRRGGARPPAAYGGAPQMGTTDEQDAVPAGFVR
jgi:capsular polysaccharide biosynthesis protein